MGGERRGRPLGKSADHRCEEGRAEEAARQTVELERVERQRIAQPRAQRADAEDQQEEGGCKGENRAPRQIASPSIPDLFVSARGARHRSEEHTSELQSLMRISYAVFCLKKK